MFIGKPGWSIVMRFYIVSKSRYHVLRFYKNNNRKHSISNACGCFEMVEATGVEPVS